MNVEKKKLAAQARKKLQDAAQEARTKRHVLCLDGDPTKPITVDDGAPVAAKIKPV